MDSHRTGIITRSGRLQTPDEGPAAKSNEGRRKVMTRSMMKNLGPQEDGTTLLASQLSKKGEKRKRTVTKKEPEEKVAVIKSCTLCEDELASVTFYPCRHHACCVDCSLRLKKCPKCKRAISTKVREDGQTIEIAKPVSYTELLSKVRELEENQLCSICMANKKSIVFNCGHMACQSCTNSLTTCHYCRAGIRTRTRIFEV